MLLRSITRKVAIGLVGLATVAVGSVAYADVLSYSGTTNGRPSFNRPTIKSPFQLSGQVVQYHGRQFIADQTTFCSVDSTQSGGPGRGFDGVIHVYKGSFNPAQPTVNVIFANDDFYATNFGYSRIEPFRVEANVPYIIVTSAVAPGERTDDFGRKLLGSGDFQNKVSCDSSPVSGNQVLQSEEFTQNALDVSNCKVDVDGKAVCVGDPRDSEPLLNRFQISVNFKFQGTLKPATPVKMQSTNTALFYFFDEQIWELMIKVLNHCNEDPPVYRLSMAGTTNLYVEIIVVDTVGGQSQRFENPEGHPFDYDAPKIADSPQRC